MGFHQNSFTTMKPGDTDLQPARLPFNTRVRSKLAEYSGGLVRIRTEESIIHYLAT